MSEFDIEVYIEVFQKVLFYVINLTLRAKQNAPFKKRKVWGIG
jgi:hypothetical protein